MRKAAQDLLAILKAEASGDQGQSGESRQQTVQEHQQTLPVRAASSVQDQMTRSFPGLFRSNKNVRSFPKSAKKRTGPKTVRVPFFFLASSSEKTPKPSEELILLQAGLGRRSAHVPEDADHKEITNILCEVYPKMTELEGAWLIHKATGGSGQRKLCVISPEEEGYSGASLVKAWGGKGCLYIMPIQHTLDTSPLALTAPEFESMPKARCMTCYKDVPLQLLTMHVQSCRPEQISGPELDAPFETHTDESDDDVQFLNTTEDNDNQVSTDKATSSGHKVACPVCGELFSQAVINIHAEFCGITEESVINEEVPEPSTTDRTGPGKNSLSDLLDNLKGKIDNTKMFKINVTREDLLQRGLKQWARQKQASPQNTIIVSFIGENGIDQGALRKEFLTEMVRAIESRFFEGDERGKNPKYNVSAYQDNTFRYCGEIFAASVVQGGPAPNVLTHHTYHYLCHGQLDKDVVKAGTASVDMENLVTEVQDAEEDSLMALTDRIIACGYSGPIKVDRKKDILEAIVLHSWLRLLPILQQLRDGLALYGLDELLVEQPLLCQQLFVPGSLQGVDADFLILALSPEYSPEGSVRRQCEMRIVNLLQDYLQELEDKGEENPKESQEDDLNTCSDIKPPTVKTFCQWVTGQAHIPLGEAERSNFRVTVQFDHECHLKYGEHGVCYPIVNACSAAITIPTRHFEKASEFEVNMTEAILAGFEFNLH